MTADDGRPRGQAAAAAGRGHRGPPHGVSESSLLRWLRDPAFRAEYRAARRAVVEQAVSGLQHATSEAVAALRRNLTCGMPTVEISAAKAVLDFAVKGVELIDLAERVEMLEQATVAKERQR